MGVILDLNFSYLTDSNNFNSRVVGWPTPKPGVQSMYAWVRENALSIRQCGFTAVNFPPSVKGSAGEYSDGYDVQGNNYDLGTTSNPTAFGTFDELRHAIAACHAVGMLCYGDLVLHQYDGFDPTQPFYPLNWQGKPTGRFPKKPSYFVGPPPGVNVDVVPDSTGNFGFGSMPSFQNSTPPGELLTLTSQAADYLVQTTDFDGFRIDDVKGTNWGAVLTIFNSKAMTGTFAFGEYFDGNTSALYNWTNTLMNRRSAALDFNFKFSVGNMCDNQGRYWMGLLASTGYCLQDSFMAVTFVESNDTDNSPGEQIIWNKMLGYALMMVYPGYPRVYFRDWSNLTGCYNLEPLINNLVYIHENFANGNFIARIDNDPQVFVCERTGWDGKPGCIAGFNNDPYSMHTVTAQTVYSPNTRLHEYTGKYNTDVWTNQYGQITFTLPENINGLGYLVFAPWVEPASYNVTSIYTTQYFFGADDLPNPPIFSSSIAVGNIYVEGNTSITIEGIINSSNWGPTENAIIKITPPTGAASEIEVSTKKPLQKFSISANQTGLYTITIIGTFVDPATKVPYELLVTYLGS